MLQGQGPEPISEERGSQFVVGERKILRGRREPPLESRKLKTDSRPPSAIRRWTSHQACWSFLTSSSVLARIAPRVYGSQVSMLVSAGWKYSLNAALTRPRRGRRRR